ncbi:bL28 family ribosomal protein, partial [Pseudomonas sp. NPDC078863]
MSRVCQVTGTGAVSGDSWSL